jgi:sucrose-6-phosphate hydrolase SacC (GH32 family)
MHYDQPLRPQVHYTPITGQIADATGLIYYKGIYHLFYMFDEWSKKRGDNKNWGHAISGDCIFWEQQPPVTNTIIDNRPGSGSGIVDWNNSLGIKSGFEKTLVVFYTDYGRGISLSFSRDGGKTWIRHKRNPVLPAKNGFRDPLVFWYKPDQAWHMVIYDEPGVSFYKSKNLLDWEWTSSMEGFHECPDIIQLPIDGNPEKKKWVLIDGNGSYFIGEFDGIKFLKESIRHNLGTSEVYYGKVGDRKLYYTKDIYATQTWKKSYEGDGPFYQLGFMMIKELPMHNRTWSQQMIFPVTLTLNTINNELKLCRNPIDEIKQLRYDAAFFNGQMVKPGENPLALIKGDVFEIISELDLKNTEEFKFNIRGQAITYNKSKQELTFLDSRAKVVPVNSTIKLRIIIDRNSVEIYVNKGETTITRLFYPEPENISLEISPSSGILGITKMEIYKLESIWLKREQELGYKRGTAQ